ncbi:hypothetical protein F5I97DRAFT_1617696 [Phlebopus sp. FC_14]|nr:hypothetical protein F5I97DRAFT_1617696 [Phlebopus sp. FC_14]
MARTTRSAAQLQEKDKQPDSTTTGRGKSATKKRKRSSLADTDDQPRPKQHRSENGIKEEQQLDDQEKFTKIKLPQLELSGDVPISPSDAQKILEILELVDSQGLLDRVFPLPSSDLSEPSTSKSQTGTFSLRTLLRESSQHPLCVLRDAVKNLVPISYQPRAGTSSPAAQQLRFCNLASSLFDQASFHSVPLPLDIETILNDLSEPHADSEAKPAPGSPRPDRPSHSHQTRKYALMQRLPSGTWWTSLNSDFLPSDGKAIKDLSTANAELVAILPSAPTNVQLETPPSSTLGSYVPKKPPGYKSKLPGPRRVSCGAFLDYGPYASFAPVFDQEGVEIGRSALGEVYGQWEDRKKTWTEKEYASSDFLSDPADASMANGTETSLEKVETEDESVLEGLFSQEQVWLLKEALDSLELEAAVQELLERNAKALKILEQLQNQRLMNPTGFTPVVEGSEEWNIAQGILESLSVLASLRPRSCTTDAAPLIPSASALHKLQRTLPTAPTQGWYGTLPPGRTTALRDDSTLYIKSTATTIPCKPAPAPAPTTTAAPSQPTPATPAATSTAPTQPYTGYSYNYATPYRTGYQYKPGQTTSYYPNAYTPAVGQTPTTGQYYANQQYSTTGQQQYAYSWYQYNPQTQGTAAGGSTSGRGTPQPSTSAAAPTTMPTSYASFFSANAQTSGQRAVANTVLTTAAASGSAKTYQPPAGGTWSAGTGGGGYVPPTLPSHMKSAVGAAQAGSYSGPVYQPGYYGTYQATPSPAQS